MVDKRVSNEPVDEASKLLFLELEDKGYTQQEIADKTGWSKSVVNKHLVRLRGLRVERRRWTREEIIRLKKGKRDLDRSDVAIRLQRYRLKGGKL